MRASLVVDQGTIECVEAPAPEIGASEVLIRTRFASLCGSDLHRLYTPLQRFEGQQRPGAPGHEAVGEVVESRAADFRRGQLVLTAPDIERAACFADYQVLSPAFLLPLPTGAKVDSLVLAQPLGTVIFALKHLMPIERPETAVVLGQGSIGLFFSWLLKRAGISRVVATDLEPSRRELSRRFGADLVLDGASRMVEETIFDLTQGRGAPLVIEAAGMDGSRAQALRVASDNAMVGFFGLPTAEGMSDFPIGELYRKRLTVRSIHGTQHEPGLASFSEALSLLASGVLDVSPMLTHRFSLERIGDAFVAARQRQASIVKACITFD